MISLVTAYFYRDEETKKYSSPLLLQIDGAPSKGSIQVMRCIQDACESATVGDQDPNKVLRALMAEGGKQIVWDDNESKYRNVSTMREGEDTYQAGELKISVSAKDENKAQNKLRNKIMELMTGNPEKASEYGSWFGESCPVIKLKSGELPDVISLSDLKEPGEVKKPIKMTGSKKKNKGKK